MSVLCLSCIHWSISSLCVVIYKTLHVIRANQLKPTLVIIVFLTSKISNIKMVTLIHFLKFLRRVLRASQNNPCLSNHFRILKQPYGLSIQYNTECQFPGNFDHKSSVPLCGAIISLLKSLSFSCYVKRTKLRQSQNLRLHGFACLL